MTERLLETGFSARAALKLVNTVLLLTGNVQHPATLDLACIDLHTGILEAMKLGAAATYILTPTGVEPVSYTHLDVYKRQALCKPFRLKDTNPEGI